jgi:hypothetical protein
MSYTNIQFLAYTLNTGFGQQNGAQVYLGLPDPAADIRARCALMQCALAAARTQAVADAQTLKVFMAPEFFFRGVTGAYSLDDAMGIASALQAIAQDPQWRDWIFAFGSIVASSAPATPGGKQEVYNLTLVQMGGPDHAGEAGARVVLKEWMSGQDFIVRPVPAAAGIPAGMLYLDMVEHMTPAATDWFTTSDRLNWRSGDVQQRNDDGGGIFNAGGVTFGVEICLDHLGNRLLSAQLPGGPGVQVQLVPSCGMWVQDVAIIAAPGGAVFACDGSGRGAAALVLGAPAPKQLKRIPVIDSALATGAASLFAVATLTNQPPPESGVPVAPDPASAAGAIVIYAATTLAPPSVVGNRMRTLSWAVADRTVQFVLLFDANGNFTQLYVRVQRAGTDLNRFWYAVPAKGELNLGAITMAIKPGSGMYVSALDCRFDDGQFLGNAMLLLRRYDDGDPLTVGMVAGLPVQGSAP